MGVTHLRLTQGSWTTSLVMFLIFFVGCSSLPPAPDGDHCVMAPSRGFARCCAIPKNEAEIENPIGCYDLPIEEMEHFQAFSPITWRNIRQYMKLLEIQAQQKQKLLEACSE